MAILCHANTDEASNNGTSGKFASQSRLFPKVGDYQPSMLVVVAIVALSIFQELYISEVTAKKSRISLLQQAIIY